MLRWCIEEVGCVIGCVSEKTNSRYMEQILNDDELNLFI